MKDYGYYICEIQLMQWKADLSQGLLPEYDEMS